MPCNWAMAKPSGGRPFGVSSGIGIGAGISNDAASSRGAYNAA